MMIRTYFNYLSFPKVWNFFLLYFGYLLSRWLKRPLQWGLPMSLALEPTTACNLGCPECPSGLKKFTRPTGNLQWNTFHHLLRGASRHLLNITFYFQGEPFIHPKFLELVRTAHDANIYTSTSTNGHFLTEKTAIATVKSGLDQMIVSIDGTTQEIYEQYRINGHLDQVIQGVKNIVKAKRHLTSSTPKLIFQFLVVAPNEHQIADAKTLADELGFDEIRLKTAQVYDFEDGNPLIPRNLEYSRYRKGKDGKWKIKNKLLNQCWRMWHSCVITWDGKVVPCCFDKDAEHQMGSISEEVSLAQVWSNQNYGAFRSQILIGRDQIDICKNCTEGTKVWAETAQIE